MSITTIKNFKSSQISLGKEEQKRSKTGFKYNSIPIFYDEGAFDLLVKGRLGIFKHDKDYSISLDVDEDNKSCFKSIEAKINKEADFKERLDLIKGERFQIVYSKLYTNTKGNNNNNSLFDPIMKNTIRNTILENKGTDIQKNHQGLSRLDDLS